MNRDTFKKLTRPGCRMCPRACDVDREADEIGFCLAGPIPHVSQAGPHHGEEPPLSGNHGSGTIFLSGCNLHCRFCQNDDISSAIQGTPMDAAALAETALALEARGCHNVNFVTPTHHADVIADAIIKARDQGLAVPVVYNCGGYESIETLRLLDGLIEIYMPDVKFFDKTACSKYLQAPDYGDRVKQALGVMQEQVGDLALGERGLAVRGLLIRHLVMPGYQEDSRAILRFIAKEVSPQAFVNVMGQYWPTHEAHRFPEIDKSPDFRTVAELKIEAHDLGLRIC